MYGQFISMDKILVIWIQLFYEFHNVCMMVINIIKPLPKEKNRILSFLALLRDYR